MAEKGRPGEVWEIFDLVKVNLTDLMIKGVDNQLAGSVETIKKVKDKLSAMNMVVIADLMEALLTSFHDVSATTMTREKRAAIAATIQKIVTASRIFEVQLNIDMVKHELLVAMEGSKCKSS